MIKGYINKNLEVMVKISLIRENSTKTETDVILDTEFTGDICISKNLLHLIKLKYVGIDYFELANGEVEEKRVFLGEIIFDDERKEALFIITESDGTLLGANLLRAKEVNIKV